MRSSRTEKNKNVRKKISRIENKEKNKKIVILLIKLISILMILILTLFILLRYIGTYGLVVREYSKSYNNLPAEYHGLKVIQFSDLYYGSYINNKELNNLVNKINKIEPDIIIFTGGLLYKNINLSDNNKKSIINTLTKLKSTIGNYYVTSKDDNENVIDILNNSNFTYLDDKYEFIYYKSISPIIINGVTNKQNTDILQYEGTFNITITHEPDNIDDILNYVKPNIIMSGNSLNGQIRLPYLGGLFKFDGSQKYYDEYYNIDSTDIYISSGIGTNNYNFRLFNHPSINFYRLKIEK